MSTNEPTIVKLDSTAAFLAFLPTLNATPVRNSLVIAPFSGRFASRALRIGVDSIATGGTAQKLASAAVGVLARLEDCDYVAVVLYRDEPFDEVCRNWLPALDTVMKRLHESGYHFKDAAIVAADGWMPYFEGDPSTPMPLSDIAAAAENMPTDEHDRRELRLPATDPDLARRVTEILIDLTIDGSESDAFGRLHRTTPPDPIDLLERALTAPPETASALTLARLIHQIDTEGAVGRTVLQIAFGRDHVVSELDHRLMAGDFTHMHAAIDMDDDLAFLGESSGARVVEVFDGREPP